MNEINKKEIGRHGEEIACSFLESEGFNIIERNYNFKKAGEIDLIAARENLLLFVEVKSRNTGRYGGALYSIGARKKRTLRLVANQFLASHPEFNKSGIICRFDMIALENNEIRWVEDIFR